jgi:hypothetical protein
MNLPRLLIVLVIAAAAGCGTHGTPVLWTQPSAAPSVPDIQVVVEGLVIDGDRDVPVSGALVTARGYCAPGICTDFAGASGRADEQGAFRFTASLPPAWSELLVDVTREGYELTRIYIRSASATTAGLKLLPSRTIRAGDSIQTSLVFGTYYCGFESWLCRRIVVEAPSGEKVDLEVTPLDGQSVGFMVGPVENHAISPNPTSVVTTSSGEVWLYGVAGRVTLTARRH